MTREDIDRDKLHDILNQELHRIDQCGECRFTQPPGLLHIPDESGCNWSQDLILRHGRFGNDLCSEIASRVITYVAARFNLKSSDSTRPKQELPTNKTSSAAQKRMRSRETYLYFQIDANRINARQKLPGMNRLEQWDRDGVIGLLMSDTAHTEAKADGNAQRSHKTVGYIYSLSFEGEPDTQKIQSTIADILFPNGFNKPSDVNDVRILYNALQYSFILVTADKVILRSRDALAQLGLRIVTDTEAVALVEQAIKDRDAEARQDADATGEPLPFWVGKD